MLINIATIDDENFYIEALNKELTLWSKQKGCHIELDKYTNASKFLASTYITYDIIFLDIELNDIINGLEIAQNIRKNGYEGSIVFLTNYMEFVLQGYDVKAMNYLMKPIKKEDIKKCMDEVYSLSKRNCYLFTSNNQVLKIAYQQILYFSASNHYVEVYTVDNVYKHKAKLSDIKCHLPLEFIQCHRSLIVNIKQVHQIKNHDLFLLNGTKLPISETFLDEIQAKLIDSID